MPFWDNVDLKQLEYFQHVAELGSFTRAAAYLSVVQPALSRQVQALETELGQDLFDRNGRGVILTEAGKRLLEHARGILNQVERARHELLEHRTADAGHVIIGLPPSLGRGITVPLVAEFRSQLPKATIATVEGLSTYILEWLAIGRVDCGILYNATPAPQFHLVPLCEEPLYLMSARTSGMARKPAPVRLDAVAGYPLIIPSRPHTMRMAVEHALAAVGARIQVALEIESISAIIELVAQGYGHAVLPMAAVHSSTWSEALIARPVSNPGLSSSLWIATAAQRPRSAILRKAVQLIGDVVRREVGANSNRRQRATA
jgi:LysR family transcriptional regulator, nitrogen assimilation regulatory protein